VNFITKSFILCGRKGKEQLHILIQSKRRRFNNETPIPPGGEGGGGESSIEAASMRRRNDSVRLLFSGAAIMKSMNSIISALVYLSSLGTIPCIKSKKINHISQ
jgi:hypothetical protein